MDRDAYGVYDRTRGNRVEDYPYTIGQAYRTEWRHVNPAHNTYNWSQLDELLQFAYDQKQ